MGPYLTPRVRTGMPSPATDLQRAREEQQRAEAQAREEERERRRALIWAHRSAVNDDGVIACRCGWLGSIAQITDGDGGYRELAPGQFEELQAHRREVGIN